jgi:hypothetical protein
MSDYINSASAVRVYCALQSGQQFTLSELAEAAHVARRSLDNMASTFFACGLMHICGWKRPVESQYQLVAIYRAGPGRNKPRPKRRKSVGLVRERMSAHRIVKALAAGQMTHHDIAEAAGIAPEYCRHMLLWMVKADMVHVCDWMKRNQYGQLSPVYAAGKGVNKSKPAGAGNAERLRARRQRLVSQFGVEIARRIDRTRAEGGPDQIVIDGQTVYRRRAA